MLFVYRSEHFKEVLKGYKNLASTIDKLANQVEKKQSFAGFEGFQKDYYVKKKVQYIYRLIARLERIKIDGVEHFLLVFHDLLERKSKSYADSPDSFCVDPEKYAKAHKYMSSTYEADCRKYCESRLRDSNQPIPKADLSDYENQVLFSPLQGTKDKNDLDRMVYESRDWVTALNEPRNRDLKESMGLTTLYTAINEVSDKDIGEGWRIKSYLSNGRSKYVCYYATNEMIFLGSIFDRKVDAEQYNTKNNTDCFAKYLNVDSKEESAKEYKKEILRLAARSYPDTVFAGQGSHSLWVDIEMEKSNNMSLSTEELELLNESLHSDSRCFPLFINGRAGSGKSTILQFLFTAYYFHYLNSESKKCASPVYFTYNDKLLTVARDTVRHLLNNHKYLGNPSLSDEKREQIERKIQSSKDTAFRNFSNFLLEVSGVYRDRYFKKQNKVDFQKFSEMWNERFGRDADIRKKLTPEMCWHALRTYIKGNSVDALMDCFEYAHWPNHTISEEKFKLIYDRVWKEWYSTKTLFADYGDGKYELNPNAEFWDDQDLVRFVLQDKENGSLLTSFFENRLRFVAIFCDESQDFTRIELEAILEMSLYLYRNIDARNAKHIPFVFAGDPFQTLNPTGFSWAITKTGFVDKIVRVLDQKADNVNLNYKELKMNYRSSADIVKTSNGIQIIRAAKLNPEKEIIEPQIPWNESNGKALLYNWNDADFWKWVSDNPDVAFVLPCEEGALEEYVCRHPKLKERIWNGPEDYKYSIFTSVSVKGLEYDRVVIYGFADYDNTQSKGAFKKLLVNPQFKPSENERLSLEYFINRLYVAMTRPRKQLFILDTPDDSFWTLLKNGIDPSATDPISWLVSMIPDNCKARWNQDSRADEKISVPEEGTREGLSGRSTTEDIMKNAEQLIKDGVADKRIDLLKFALSQLEHAGKRESVQYHEVKACIAYLREEFTNAADEFEKAGCYLASMHCYFMALHIESVAGDSSYVLMRDKIAGLSRDAKFSLEYTLAQFCASKDCSPMAFDEVISKFSSLVNQASDSGDNYSQTCGHRVFDWQNDFARWTSVINYALKKFVESSVSETAEKYAEYAEKLEQLANVVFEPKYMIKLCLNAKKYEKVKDLGELILSEKQDTDIQRLVKMADALLSPFPENLPKLCALGEFREAVNSFVSVKEKLGEEEVVKKLNKEQISGLFEAYKKAEMQMDASVISKLFRGHVDFEIWKGYYSSLNPKKERSVGQESIQLLSELHARGKDKAKSILDKMKSSAEDGTVEGFNRFYIYSMVISKDHILETSEQIKRCALVLQNVFFAKNNPFTKYAFSLVDCLEFGRLFEFVALRSRDAEGLNAWEAAIKYYKMLLEMQKEHSLDVLDDMDSARRVYRRMVYCQNKELALLDSRDYRRKLSKGEHFTADQKVRTVSTDMKYVRDNHSIENPKEIPANDPLTKGSLEDLATKIWQNHGYIVNVFGASVVSEEAEELASAQEPSADEPVQTIEKEEDSLNEENDQLHSEPVLSADESATAEVEMVSKTEESSAEETKPVTVVDETVLEEIPSVFVMEKPVAGNADPVSEEEEIPADETVPESAEEDSVVEEPAVENTDPVSEEDVSVVEAQEEISEEVTETTDVALETEEKEKEDQKETTMSQMDENIDIRYKGYQLKSVNGDGFEIRVLESFRLLLSVKKDSYSPTLGKGVKFTGDTLIYSGLPVIRLVSDENGVLEELQIDRLRFDLRNL